MKKLLLAVAVSSIISSGYINAATPLPSRVTIVEYNGEYYVSEYKNGTEYAEAQKKVVRKLADDRIAGLTGSDEEIEKKKSIIESETAAANNQLDIKGAYADLTIKNMKNGMSKEEAKLAAADATFGKTVSEAGLQSGYNEGSVTSSRDNVSTISNSNFKQFNELDCSYSDVSNYIDKSLSNQTKAFSTSPVYSDDFKKTATDSAAAIKGDEEAACQTIFNDGTFTELSNLSMDDILEKIPSFDEMGNKMKDLGKHASDQVKTLATSLSDTLKEGFCSRMSSEYVGGLAGDLLEDQYDLMADGTVLDGTRIDNLDKESGQNSFTYKVIKNQTGSSDSDLIKSIDLTRDDQGDYQERFFGDAFDDYADGIEDRIFGK